MLKKYYNKHVKALIRLFDYLKDLLWKNKYMIIKNEIAIYKNVVSPAAESITDIKRTRQMLNTSEMDMLTGITKCSLREIIHATKQYKHT